MGRRQTRLEEVDKVTPELQARIAKLSLRGMSGAAITKELGGVVAERTVYRWIARMNAEYLARAQQDTALRIAQHHAQLDHVIEEAWRRLELSGKAEPIKIISPEGKEAWEDGPGDPRWLLAIIAAMDRRAKLLGTDKAPEPPGPFIGNPLKDANLSLEQAAELLQMSGSQLLDLSARTRAELAAAKAKTLIEQTGEA